MELRRSGYFDHLLRNYFYRSLRILFCWENFHCEVKWEVLKYQWKKKYTANTSRKYKFKNWFSKDLKYLNAAVLGGKTLWSITAHLWVLHLSYLTGCNFFMSLLYIVIVLIINKHYKASLYTDCRTPLPSPIYTQHPLAVSASQTLMPLSYHCKVGFSSHLDRAPAGIYQQCR